MDLILFGGYTVPDCDCIRAGGLRSHANHNCSQCRGLRPLTQSDGIVTACPCVMAHCC